MKKVTWELPFKTTEYLEDLVGELAKNPLVILVTGIQDSKGDLEKCNIHLKDTGSDMCQEHLFLGAVLGSHATAYSVEVQDKLERLYEEELEKQYKDCFANGEFPYFEDGSDCGEKVIEDEGEINEARNRAIAQNGNDGEHYEDEEEEIIIKKKDITLANSLLRKLLTNFKKY